MDIYCTRPSCARPLNSFPDLDTGKTLKTVSQKFCATCGMPLLLAGRYIVEKPLARGGFGATYIARDRYTPAMRRCVVKQLQPIGLTPDQMVIAKQMFEREGEVLEKLGHHPQIPDLLAFFEVESNGENFFYLVQEFVDGFTLEQLIEQHGPLVESDVVDVMQSLLPVLQFVHDNGSIHRDIKPSNIMIRKLDQKPVLLDFGAVKQIAATRPGLRSTGIYTPGYGAPEQMRGDMVFPSSDIYAFGVTCMYLLTGKEPEQLFDPHSNTWEWRKHVRVSKKLGDILDRMTAEVPRNRFASAQEVLEALADAPNKATVITTPPQVYQPHTSTVVELETTVRSVQAMPVPAPMPPQPVQPLPVVPRTPQKSWLLQVPLTNQLIGAFLLGFQGGLVGLVAHYVLKQAIGLVPSVLVGGGVLLTVLFLRISNTMDNKDVLVLINLGSLLLVAVLGWAFKWNLPALPIFMAICFTAGFATTAVMTLFRLIFQLLYSIL